MSRKGRIAPDMEEFDEDIIVEDGDDETPEPPRKKKRVSRVVEEKDDDTPGTNPIVEFFTDKRLHVAVGVVLCFMALMSVLMCISFLSDNVADQSVTHSLSPGEAVGQQAEVQNAGGIIGARIAQVMMVNTLGLGSFIIALYVFLLGLTCMHLIKIRFWSLTFRCLFSAVAISIIIGFFTLNQPLTFPLGGNHGMYINKLIIAYADALGGYGVSILLLTLLVIVFIRPIKLFFNAVKKMLPKPAPISEDNEDEEDETSEKPGNGLEEISGDESDEPEADATASDADPGTAPDLLIVPKDEPKDEPETPADEKPAEEKSAEEGLGFIIDEPEAESADRVIEIPKTATGEPEMIIRVADTPAEADAATNQPVRDGDHLGLDSEYDPRAEHSFYRFPSPELLENRETNVVIDQDEQDANKQRIVHALRTYGVEIVRIEATIGPTVTLYEIVPAEGIRISKIRSLEDEIAMCIASSGIRIIAPIPGKGTIGIEVPNRNRRIVGMRRMIDSAAFRAKSAKMQLPMALGATISNDIFIEDLAKMPHLLVAGSTGQGKSVGLNAIITSLIYSKHPDELKFVLIDPKMVEFSIYSPIQKAFMAKIPDAESAIITDPQKALDTLNSLCMEMEARFDLFSKAMARDIETYNKRFIEKRLNPENGHRYMPYLVTIVDEFADLITNAGKEIFVPIARLAAKGRAAGMHLIIATQRPSTDVITGVIKSNFIARIAFKTLSAIDSKTILDRPGAHRLVGRGDMLTLMNNAIERVQCAYLDTDEIEAICNHISSQEGFTGCYLLPDPPSDGETTTDTSSIDIRNEEFIQCCKYIAMQSNASITILQRKFSIGFNKAGRYIDQMEALGIVGPANGSKPRQVLMTIDSVEQLFRN